MLLSASGRPGALEPDACAPWSAATSSIRASSAGRRNTGYDHYLGSGGPHAEDLNRLSRPSCRARPGAEAALDRMLKVALEDDVLAWRLRSDGSWAKVSRAGHELADALAGARPRGPGVADDLGARDQAPGPGDVRAAAALGCPGRRRDAVRVPAGSSPCTWTRGPQLRGGECSLRHPRRGLDAEEAAEGLRTARRSSGKSSRSQGTRAPGAGEASDLVAAYSRGAELRPVVRLRTLRRRIELADDEGARSIGEVVDDRSR